MLGWIMVWLMSFAAVGSPPADPLGCEATVFDPGGVLDPVQVEAARAQAGSMLRADVRVRVEPSLDAGLDARMRQLRRQFPAGRSPVTSALAGEFTAGVIDGLGTLTIGPSDPTGPTPEPSPFPVTGGNGTGLPTGRSCCWSFFSPAWPR